MVNATLKDASGALMAGQVVTFSTEATFGSLSQTTALTNASGVATVTLSQASTATPAAKYVTASAQGLTASAGYSVGGGGGGGGGVTVGSVSVTAAPASVTADGFSLITIKATVLDAAAAPIANQTVNFTSVRGSLSSSTATTNASGVAQVFLTAPTTVGSTNIVAFTGAVPASALVTFVAGLPANINLSMPVVSVAALGTTTITAALTDYYGNPVGAGQTVTFGTSSTTGGHFTDLSGVAATSAITDPLGMARVLYVAGTCTGSCTDFLTANATNAAKTTTYATNLVTLPVGGTAGTPTLTISTITSPIAAGAPVTVTATLKDATATAVSNAVVTFSVTDPTLATLTPSNGTALTNSSGIATITLTASLISGATYLNAAAQVGNASVTALAGFSVGGASVTLSNFVFGVNPLSAFGTTSMAVSVSGVPVTTPITVNFSSVCATAGKAVISSSATTVGGVATGSYRDKGCAATDTITATASGSTLTGNLAVNAPAIGSLQFVAASPTTISLKGIGGTETSQVTFKVVDTGGNPLSGQTVSFGLSTTNGGITLTPAGSPPTATSDNNGLVVITVNAGVVSTPVRVTATAGALTSQSSQLTITTGIPDQDSFSLSASTLNIEGWNYDGITSVLTARLADHFNNPVPDGTAVNFTSEGGSIVGSCTTTNGACSSTFTSQNPRPTNGRVTVLAYAVGEESFTDLNGNGLADAGPLVCPGPNCEMKDANGTSTDMPEAWVDYNEDGVHNANETFFDFNSNGTYDGPDGFYNGVLCDSSVAPGSTATACSLQKTIHVRRSIPIVFSGSGAVITITPAVSPIDLGGCAGGQNVQIDVRDSRGQVMPAGTTIVVKTSDGILSIPNSFIVGNTNQVPSLNQYTVSISPDGTLGGGPPPVCTDPTGSGTLLVTVTTPLGTVTNAFVNVIN